MMLFYRRAVCILMTSQPQQHITCHLLPVTCRGFIKGRAPGKLTCYERDLAINLPGCFHLLFLLAFIRKTKNAQLKNPTDLLHKDLMKPLHLLPITHHLEFVTHHP